MNRLQTSQTLCRRTPASSPNGTGDDELYRLTPGLRRRPAPRRSASRKPSVINGSIIVSRRRRIEQEMQNAREAFEVEMQRRQEELDDLGVEEYGED